MRRLKAFSSLERLDFNVSIDEPRRYHEWHRGKSTYDRTIDFCRELLDMGVRSLTVRMLLMRESIHSLDEFMAEPQDRVGPQVQLAISAPYTNRILRGVRSRARAINQVEIDDGFAITRQEALEILAGKYNNRFELDEDPDAVDNYLSLTTYGVSSRCHGIIKLGDPGADIATLRAGLLASERQCRACSMFPCM